MLLLISKKYDIILDMAATLRLYRLGKKGYATYKIVAVNKRYKSNGDYIESIGTYNPNTDPADIKIDFKKLEYWRQKGAIISEGLSKLLKSVKK